MELIWYAAGAALLAVLAWALARRKKPAPAASGGEEDPVPVEGSTACTGRHRGVKYWLYFEEGRARVEIETRGEIAAPFSSERVDGRLRLPGDDRDHEVRELFRLGALGVEARASGEILAQFEERELNVNAGTRFAPRPDAEAAGKASELLAAIRDKSAPAAADGV